MPLLETLRRQLLLSLLLLLDGSCPAAARWNLLYFSVSDNSLECNQLQNLWDLTRGMKTLSAASAPNVFVYVDRAEGSCDGQDGSDVLHASWTNAKDLIINAGGNVTTVRDYPEPNQSTPDQLASFIQRAVAAFPPASTGTASSPAKYMLVINDHGGAWAGAGEDDHDSTGAINILTPGWFTVPALLTGIWSGLKAANLTRLDLLGFDACLMSNYEVAAQLAPLTRYYLASQMTEPSSGWNWASLPGALSPTAAATDIGTAVVNAYVASPGCQATGVSCTLALWDMGALTSQLVPAMTTLSNALVSQATASHQAALDAVTQISNQAGQTDDADAVGADLQGVLQLLVSSAQLLGGPTGAVATAAKSASAALTASQLYFAKGAQTGGLIHAMSVYLPGNGDLATTSGTALAIAAWNLSSFPGIKQWLAFLQAIYKPGTVTIGQVTAATSAAALSFTQLQQFYFYVAYDVQATLPANIAAAISSGKLHFGFSDPYTPGYYIIAGSHAMNGTVFEAASSDQTPRTAESQFDGMFMGLKQTLAEDPSGYTAVSMAHVQSFVTSFDSHGQPTYVTIQMGVMYADQCTASGDSYISGTLTYIVPAGSTGDYGGTASSVRLFTTGNAGVFGGPGSNSTLQAEVLPAKGGVIITYLKRLKLNGDGTATESLTFEYTDCFKWGYPDSLQLLYDYSITWTQYTQFKDLTKNMALIPMVTTASGQDAYFRPATVATPLADAGVGSGTGVKTLSGCTCAWGWGDIDGTVYTKTCAPAYSPESANPGAQIGTWCPIASPAACAGGRTWDLCTSTPIAQPSSYKPCAPALQQACSGLVALTSSGGPAAAGGGFTVTLSANGSCPARLQASNPCFLALGQQLMSGPSGCSDVDLVSSLVDALLHQAVTACEAQKAYLEPAYLLLREVVSANANNLALCPELSDYATWDGYADTTGILSAGELTNYNPSSTCHWIIEAPPSLPHITLVPLDFQTEALYDVVYVYDGRGLMAAFSGQSLPPTLQTSTGFLRLLFTTDDTVEYSGFQLQYTLSASLDNATASPPQCTQGQALATAVVNVFGAFGSDVSWALAQGPTLAGPPSQSTPGAAPPSGFKVLGFGGNAPRADSPAGQAILPSYPAVLTLYGDHIQSVQHFCVPAASSLLLYLFSSAGVGWGGSTLDLYVGSTFHAASNVTLSGSAAFGTQAVYVPALTALTAPTAPYQPPTAPGASLSFQLSFTVSDINVTPPTLVRYYARLGLASALNVMLNWVTASTTTYTASSKALTIAFTVAGLPQNTAQAKTVIKAYVQAGTMAAVIQGQLQSYLTQYDSTSYLTVAVVSGLQ